MMPSFLKSHSGFTLLEVLVAFSLLSILLTVIMQSQSETAYFLEKTGKQQMVQQVSMNALSLAERYCVRITPESDEGVFLGGHPLAGDRWQRTTDDVSILGLIPMTRISYRISWENPRGKGEHVFESSILCGRR
ncbi:MAG: type II secretion system protein [bacterium]